MYLCSQDGPCVICPYIIRFLGSFVDERCKKFILFLYPLPGHKITRPLVIVLDDDNDEETLRQRPLGDIHPSILRAEEILEGPHVWKRA